MALFNGTDKDGNVTVNFLFLSGSDKFPSGTPVTATINRNTQKITVRPKSGNQSGIAVDFSRIVAISCHSELIITFRSKDDLNNKNALVFGLGKKSSTHIGLFVQELSKQTNLIPDVPGAAIPSTQPSILEYYDSPEEEAVAYAKKQLEIQKEELELQKQQIESQAKCPRCGSTSLSGNKKGFGIGKAVMGAAVAGPLGLVAGNIGSKKSG